MPRASTIKRYNTFVAGLVTEANALTYPENASIDEANFNLNRDGSRRRRQGMDYESSYSLSANMTTTTFEDDAITSHVWKNAANSGLYSFAVVQVGATIHFYDNTKSSISANKKSFTIDLTSYKTPTASNVGRDPISTASGKGALFIVSKTTEPLMVEYDTLTDTITVTQITLKIRDFFGVSDGLDIDEHPTTLSTEHEYNLLNQGWDSTKISSYYTSQSEYPSNTQVWTDGKDSSDVFQPSELIKEYFGTTPAPKGHYVIDAFNRDRDSVSGLTGLTTEVEKNRPSTAAFYAGRIWYSGVESEVNTGPSSNANIYYSQLLDTKQDLSTAAGSCYQEADPTSESVSDLIATDGGIITIPEAGTIQRLVPVRSTLLVLANNGVWQVSGDTDAGFSADANQVIKVTNIGTVNPASVVVVEDSVFFWSEGGIYVIQPGQVGNIPAVQNITVDRIQSLYLGLSSISRLYCVGEYDQTSRKVSWLYNSDDTYDGTDYRYNYNKELVFDINLGAFYKHSVSSLASNSPYLCGYVQTPSTITSTVNLDVIVGGDAVEVGGDQVYITESNPSGAVVSNKYLTAVPQSGGANTKITFSLYRNSNFLDWETADGTGIDYTSYLVTGYDLFDDDMRDKQVDYIMFHFNRTETGYKVGSGVGVDFENPSSCNVQSRFDWSDSTASNKWGTAFEAYRLSRFYLPSGVGDTFDYGFSTISTKNILKGGGKSLSLYIYSSAGKDMHLLGWSLTLSGNTIV